MEHLTDIERIGDLTEDMAEAAQKRIEDQIPFSKWALADIQRLSQHVHTTYTCALNGLRDRDYEMARHACEMEEEFDHLYHIAREDHIQRLEDGICQAEAEVIFVELLRNLERISDHADNLGVSVSRT